MYLPRLPVILTASKIAAPGQHHLFASLRPVSYSPSCLPSHSLQMSVVAKLGSADNYCILFLILELMTVTAATTVNPLPLPGLVRVVVTTGKTVPTVPRELIFPWMPLPSVRFCLFQRWCWFAVCNDLLNPLTPLALRHLSPGCQGHPPSIFLPPPYMPPPPSRSGSRNGTKEV